MNTTSTVPFARLTDEEWRSVVDQLRGYAELGGLSGSDQSELLVLILRELISSREEMRRELSEIRDGLESLFNR